MSALGIRKCNQKMTYIRLWFYLFTSADGVCVIICTGAVSPLSLQRDEGKTILRY